MSAAPASIRAAMDSQNQCDSANTRLATPKMATAANITRPTWRWMGRADSHRPMATSPTVMDERSRPRPSGPTLSTSCAYTGSRATTPPSSTANRSSEIVPRMMGRVRMKWMPSPKRCHSEPPAGAMAPDRKSTRLNSSHSQISYAVFCLKKKKKIAQHQPIEGTTNTNDNDHELTTARQAQTAQAQAHTSVLNRRYGDPDIRAIDTHATH